LFLTLHPPFPQLVNSGVFPPTALIRSVNQMRFEHYEWAAKAIDRLGGKSVVGRLSGALLKSLASMEWDGNSPATIPEKQKRVSETDIKQQLYRFSAVVQFIIIHVRWFVFFCCNQAKFNQILPSIFLLVFR